MREVESIDRDTQDPFELDVRLVVDVGAGDAGAACDTSDGCPPTCASSCASR